jgi:hypothetical protein
MIRLCDVRGDGDEEKKKKKIKKAVRSVVLGNLSTVGFFFPDCRPLGRTKKKKSQFVRVVTYRFAFHGKRNITFFNYYFDAPNHVPFPFVESDHCSLPRAESCWRNSLGFSTSVDP